jgi:hypothetical protein
MAVDCAGSWIRQRRDLQVRRFAVVNECEAHKIQFHLSVRIAPRDERRECAQKFSALNSIFRRVRKNAKSGC